MKKYKEVFRCGSYGVAKRKQIELRLVYDGEVYIFKDLSASPFTSFMTSQYVVAVEIKEENK